MSNATIEEFLGTTAEEFLDTATVEDFLPVTPDQPLGVPAPTFQPETAAEVTTEAPVTIPEPAEVSPLADIREKAELATSGDPAVVWEGISQANKFLREKFTGEFIPFEEIKTETGLS